MDPVSIISAAGAVSKIVYSVSGTLYTFVNATKNVNQSVKMLKLEVDGLKGVLDAIVSSLENPLMETQQDTTQLFVSVYDAIEDCQNTVEVLADLLKTVLTKNETNNPFLQSLRQIKLNLIENDIKKFMSQIHTQSMILQMALQTIILQISVSSPNRIIGHISSKIEVVQEMMAKTSMYQSQSQLSADEMSRNTLIHAERLKKSAEAVVSSATTIVGANSTLWSGSERTSTTGSEYGEPISTANRTRIEKWITQPSIDEDLPEELESSNPENRRQQTVYDERKANVSTAVDDIKNLVISKATEESESDEEVELEVVQKFLERGLQHYKRQNHTEAANFLRRGLRRADKISTQNKDLLKLKQARLALALTYSRQGRQNESEQMLLALTEEEATQDGDAACIFHASHSLAEVYMDQLNFEAAQVQCQKAVVGRRQIFGNEHLDYHKSVNLLASIYKASGDPIADVFADLVKTGLPTKSDKVEATSKLRLQDKEARLAMSRAGFDVDAKDFDKGKALEWAAIRGNNDAVVLLLEMNARIEEKYSDGRTALYLAARNGNELVVRTLLNNGAKIDAKDVWGRTALTGAAYNGHEEVVRLLLRRGADAREKDSQGKTAADHTSNKAIVQLLKDSSSSSSRSIQPALRAFRRK